MGVHKAADIFNLGGNGLRIAAFGAFKGHMFKHMGNALFMIAFIASASINPYTNRQGGGMRHRPCCNFQPIGKFAYSCCHTLRFRARTNDFTASALASIVCICSGRVIRSAICGGKTGF